MLSHTLRSASAFDRSKIDWGFALRSSAGVALPLVVALGTGDLRLGASAAIGALSAGFASQQGVYRTRAAAMLWTSGGMALSAWVGALVGHLGVLDVVAVALWGYAYGIVASLGPAATAAALNSTIAFLVFGNLNVVLTPEQAALQAAAVCAGGALQTLLLVVVWPISRFALERRSLAAAYDALAVHARDMAGRPERAPPGALIAGVRSTLADPQPFARRGDVAVFQALLDEAERIRNSLGALTTIALRTAPDSDDARLSSAATAEAAAVLSALAAALRDGRAPREDGGAWERIVALHGGSAALSADLAALFGRLRAAWRIAQAPSGEYDPAALPVVRGFAIPRFSDALETLVANVPLASPYGRLGVRLAVTLAVAAALYHALNVRNGYWMGLTVVLLLKPDFTTTIVRGVSRVAGTIVGAGVATAIAVYLNPGQHVEVALCIVFAALGYVAFNANYAVYTTTITAYVIFMLALLGQPEQAAVTARVAATLAGAGLAALATLLWPTWESVRVNERLATLLDKQRVYAARIFAAYVVPEATGAAAVRDAQAASWAARSAAEASVDAMGGEPARTHAIPLRCALGILAASQRIALGLLALNAHRTAAAGMERPWLRALAADVDSALAAAATALRGHRAPADVPALRPASESAQPAAGTADPVAVRVLAELDMIVDGVNTLLELVTDCAQG